MASTDEVVCLPADLDWKRPLLARRSLLEATVDGKGKAPEEEFIRTSDGSTILVAREGDPAKPAIVTYPDLGLDYISNFHTFFHSSHMSAVLDSFSLYHVHAPGQESGGEELPKDLTYPTMDELSEQVEYVLHYYGITTCVGFGAGLGANVLVRLARRRPTMMDGLITVNCTSQTAGWAEWVYHKVNIRNLKKHLDTTDELPGSVVEYLLWHHFGRRESGRSVDLHSLVLIYKQHFSKELRCHNFMPLLQSFMQRSDIRLSREIATNGKPLLGAARSLRTPVLNLTGDHSPHVDATVAFNGRLQPDKCTWMKIQDAAMVLEEQPAKVAEATKLFLQGIGYVVKSKTSPTAKK